MITVVNILAFTPSKMDSGLFTKRAKYGVSNHQKIRELVNWGEKNKEGSAFRISPFTKRD